MALHYVCSSVTSVPLLELITEYYASAFRLTKAFQTATACCVLEYFINVRFRFLHQETYTNSTDCDKSCLRLT